MGGVSTLSHMHSALISKWKDRNNHINISKNVRTEIGIDVENWKCANFSKKFHFLKILENIIHTSVLFWDFDFCRAAELLVEFSHAWEEERMIYIWLRFHCESLGPKKKWDWTRPLTFNYLNFSLWLAALGWKIVAHCVTWNSKGWFQKFNKHPEFSIHQKDFILFLLTDKKI